MDPAERLLVVTVAALAALGAFLLALYLVLRVAQGGGGVGCAAMAVPPLAGLGGALAALLGVRLLANRD